jgi:hypothetical protein
MGQLSLHKTLMDHYDFTTIKATKFATLIQDHEGNPITAHIIHHYH